MGRPKVQERGGGGAGAREKSRIAAARLDSTLSSTGGAPSPAPPLPAPDEPSRLALAFQAGDRTVLASLHRVLHPLMTSAFARYRDQPGALPAGLERDDLVPQSWLILADLATRWDPAGGSF